MTIYGIAVRTPPPAPPPRDRPEPCTDPRGCQDPEYGCSNACGLTLVAQARTKLPPNYLDLDIVAERFYARSRPLRPAIVRPPRRFWTHLVQILRAFRRITHEPRLLDPDRPRLLD